jgi:hypothetical protein
VTNCRRGIVLTTVCAYSTYHCSSWGSWCAGEGTRARIACLWGWSARTEVVPGIQGTSWAFRPSRPLSAAHTHNSGFLRPLQHANTEIQWTVILILVFQMVSLCKVLESIFFVCTLVSRADDKLCPCRHTAKYCSGACWLMMGLVVDFCFSSV